MARFIGKRRYFFKPTPAQIIEHSREIRDVHAEPEELVDIISNTSPEIAFRLTNCVDGNPIISREHYEEAYGGPYRIDGKAGRPSWHFLRHGNEATITQFRSTEELHLALENLRRRPREELPPHIIDTPWSNIHYFFLILTSEAYERAFQRHGTKISGKTWKPLVGNDRRIRKTFLTQELEASWITCYCEQDPRLSIRIGRSYDDSYAVPTDGATVRIERVPSRRIKVPPYSFDLYSVPRAYNSFRHIIALSIGSTLDNHPFKRNLGIAYRGARGRKKQKDPHMLFFVAQDIAAIHKDIREFYTLPAEELRRINHRRVETRYARIVPLETSLVRIPNQNSVSFYLNLIDRVIIAYRDERGRVRDRNPTMGEYEIFMSTFVKTRTHGLWDSFFLPGNQRMQELDWVHRPIYLQR